MKHFKRIFFVFVLYLYSSSSFSSQLECQRICGPNSCDSFEDKDAFVISEKLDVNMNAWVEQEVQVNYVMSQFNLKVYIVIEVKNGLIYKSSIYAQDRIKGYFTEGFTSNYLGYNFDPEILSPQQWDLLRSIHNNTLISTRFHDMQDLYLFCRIIAD